jgi:two-component system, chemotaxis family, CheB/CheR fusion protein
MIGWEQANDVAAVLREVQVADKGVTFIMRILPYRNVNNVIDGVVITFMDISERKRAEEEATLLVGELDHRVKNIMAVVSAVIAQTLKASATPGAFAASMEGRIAAIARAHGLMTQRGVQGAVSLRKIIETELAPYDLRGRNIAIDGDGVTLTPKAGLTFAMAIHELASNAAKYGSLSTAADDLLSHGRAPARRGNISCI